MRNVAQLTAALDALETVPFFDWAAAFEPAVEIEGQSDEVVGSQAPWRRAQGNA